MLFCDLEMAARIERAEVQLLLDACARVARRVEDVFVLPLCGGVAALTEEGSPLNKVSGLGFGAPFDPAAFEDVERVHEQRGAAVLVELATLADPSIAKWLTGRGYELVGVENVLGRGLSSAAPNLATRPATDDIRVDRSGEDEFEVWMDVLVSGFAAPDTQGLAAQQEFGREVLDRVMREFSRADRVLRYTAKIDGQVVGGGSMRVFDSVAQLCGAATLPSFRRRGVQSGLLARRLADASRDGCDVAVVTTQPGSKSQQNAQRQGFELLYSRNVLLRAAR